MAKLVFGMNQSLDGYVDHMAFAPSPTLFRHFIEQARDQTGSVYGRRLYEVMAPIRAAERELNETTEKVVEAQIRVANAQQLDAQVSPDDLSRALAALFNNERD